jgi:hypothetical protein
MYKTGNTIRFGYAGKIRFCRIEKVRTHNSPIFGVVVDSVTGWDCIANAPTGGYRTFKICDMVGAEIVG